MLKDNKKEVKVGDLIILRLSAGEEVIGKVDHLDEENIYLSKPYRPIMTQQGLALAPFSVLSSSDSAISKKHIVSNYPPDGEVETQYLQIASGIDLTTSIPTVSAK